MQKLNIEVIERTGVKTSGVRKERQSGFLPGVAYGPDFEPVNIKMEKVVFASLSKKLTNTTPINLIIKKENGETVEKLTYLKHVQRHKVNDSPITLDFYVPSAGRVMNIEVPVEYIGDAKGVELGGMLEIHVETLLIEALPKDIPETINVDVSDLGLDEYIKAEEIKLPEGIKLLSSGDEVIVSVRSARNAVETEETEGEEKQPEVLTAKKEA